MGLAIVTVLVIHKEPRLIVLKLKKINRLMVKNKKEEEKKVRWGNYNKKEEKKR